MCIFYIDISPLRLDRSDYNNRDINCYNIRNRTIVMQTVARTKTTKEKRNPLLDQVKHTGLTHFKPNSAVMNHNNDESRNNMCSVGDEDEDYDDEDNSTISSRLKAISDRYLKSSTHRFLAKFYKNPSTKTDKLTAETEEPIADKNKIHKVR